MDDPWGSPWNTTTGERSQSPTKSIHSARSDLEPPPRAFLSASNSPRLPPASLHSPWEDNDGLGDWAGGTASPAPGWGGWAGDATPQKHQATPKPTDEGFGFGSASPIAWPGNVVGAKHVSGTPFRETSFDPWAPEVDEPRPGQDAPHFVIDRPTSPTDIGDREEDKQSQEQESSGNSAEDHNNNGYLQLEGIAPDTVGDGLDVVEHHESTNTEESERPDAQGRFQEGHGALARSNHSRSSSVSQHDSDHDTDRQDSPITSVDEDARSRMPLPTRKVSGRIQVLVEKFDGLAKAAEEEPITLKRSRSVAPQPPDVPATGDSPDDAAEFGDFEDAEVLVEEPSSPTRVHAAESPLAEPPPEPAFASNAQKDASPVEQSSPTSARMRLGAADSASSDVRHVANTFNDVKFDVNTALVDDLFKDIRLDSTESGADPADVPDYPITDSFTEMSERKVWYRISRQGSSRKHNFGDWDSYRRVTWETSALHADVLKIVRRWMEQDSITGRTTLGGGTNKTDIFGWDSGAEPVALEKVFARKHRPVERPVSLQQPLQMPPISPMTSVPATRKSSAGQRPSSLGGPPASAFGWSSAPVTAKGDAPRKPPQTQDSVPPPKQGPPQSPVKPVVVPTPIVLSATQQTEEDDDWGEMVSSPVEAPKTTPLDAVFQQSPRQAAPPSRSRSVTTAPDVIKPQETLVSRPPEVAVPTVSVQPQPLANKPGAFGDLSLLEAPETPRDDSVRSVQPHDEDSAEAERLVRQVIGHLPDLSYMLK
ncbi:hypothetical protein DL546_009372 [Coniochaeta pulveracea]|uniref:Uncharacterized protein n=1 Tax=Coniochaeta pulveracea TaxID=177199 RepID=A0A420YJ83_9PEZI|nr:hypothetical protein DL546_009372 [Coniochaeta pulveracea]